MSIRTLKAAEGEWTMVVESGKHRWLADADPGVGDELGPDPHELFDASLAVCTAITVLMVARRKQWPLEDCQVALEHEETADRYVMRRTVKLVGPLDDEQRSYLLGIANKCPIHRLLHKTIEVETALADG